MAKDLDTMEGSNRRVNADIRRVSDPARRQWLQGGMDGLAMARLAGHNSLAAGSEPRLAFRSVPASNQDAMVVPEGYEAVAFVSCGEPVGVPGHMPAWRIDASDGAVDQAVQMGMHHDGIHYVPIAGSRTHGLLVMNHEFTDDGLPHPGGIKTGVARRCARRRRRTACRSSSSRSRAAAGR